MCIYPSKSNYPVGVILAIPLFLLLGSCAGNYQAPVMDEGETTILQRPEIVAASDDRPTRYVGAANPVAQTVAARIQEPPIAAISTGPTHSVVGGETLYSIAFLHDKDFRSLAIANNLSPPYTIFVGQQLSLDINAPAIPLVEAEPVTAGVVVNNNSVARAQPASNSSRGVIRQPIRSATTAAEPNWQWPIRGEIARDFQANVANSKGIDIGGRLGQPVYAAANGDVVYAGNGIQGSGNLIIVRHNDRFLSAYAHNSALLVNVGDPIQAGDTIAEVGANPEGVPLLHFEIRMDGNPVDPRRFLPAI